MVDKAGIEAPKQPYLGAHVSIAGGVAKAPLRGKELTCDCIQIFSKNQNQWKAKPLSSAEILAFQDGWEKCEIKTVLIHDSYLINLASPEMVKWKMSLEAFMEEIDRAKQLGVKQLVFHPGSHMGAGEQKGLEKIAQSLNYIIDKRPHSQVTLLLETTAGQGSNLGYRFEHLAQIIDLVEDKKRLAVCYDTAHSFAAGYDIRTKANYDITMKVFDQIIGLERLQAFHLNDSKKDLGTRVDRHEHIGEGLLGKEAFKFILNDLRFYGLGMYLETPQADEEYLRNLKVLRSLLNISAATVI
jgi:deoxyribonuclease-4